MHCWRPKYVRSVGAGRTAEYGAALAAAAGRPVLFVGACGSLLITGDSRVMQVCVRDPAELAAKLRDFLAEHQWDPPDPRRIPDSLQGHEQERSCA